MCGGIIFKIDKLPKDELEHFYEKPELDRMERSGEVASFFWSKKPVLPVEDDGKVSLFEWGNRDKNIKLPQTGWARSESIDEGKWAHLDPKFVSIPAKRGYEKKVWFDIKKGIQGVVVEGNDMRKAYIVTKEADPKYQKLTKHNRQPVEVK